MDLTELHKAKLNFTRHPWELARAKVVMHILKNVSIEKDTWIIDVGCGDAFFLRQLCRKYPENYFLGVDVEFTDEVLKKLSSDLPSNVVLTDSLQNINLNGKKVSVVLLMDVIEHVPDDFKLIKDIQSAIEKSQHDSYHLLITVPAFQYLFSHHDVFLKHFRRYNLSMLKNLCIRLNYQLIQKGYFFFCLFVARNIIKFLENARLVAPQTEGVSAFKGGRWISGLYQSVLWWDYIFFSMLSKFGMDFPGLSAYILCRKPSS
ncbi:MAG: class I SAM-dependent methyltransferase [Bacteroidia bacterium]|nr:class I SAM-dependent methyltransferase [Bacteroidia bacterium]